METGFARQCHYDINGCRVNRRRRPASGRGCGPWTASKPRLFLCTQESGPHRGPATRGRRRAVLTNRGTRELARAIAYCVPGSRYNHGMGSLRMPTPEDALPGRDVPMRVPPRHTVLGTPLQPPFPEGSERAIFGLGCFWGAEKKFWQMDGVYTTAVGYAGGYTKNPTYREVRSGDTGHTQAGLGVYGPG